MKVTSRQLQIGMLVLAVLIFLIAALSATHVLNLEFKVVDELTTYMLFGGVGLFMWSRKIRKEEDAAAAAKKEEDEKAADAVVANAEGEADKIEGSPDA